MRIPDPCRRGPRWISLLLLLLAIAQPTHAERIKELASISGVRDNQLVGHGLVVGLDGTGDQTSQAAFTVQSLLNMLGNMGMTVPQGTRLQLRNVAAVIVTATLPPFARPGQALDVTVSATGNAKSLRGGTLVMTPLKGVDGQIYAIAQGNVVVGGVAASTPGQTASLAINHQSAGRIPAGATVERAVPATVGEGEYIHVELRESDFTNAIRVSDAINGIAPGSAQALDARSIQVWAPVDATARVAFIGQIENLEITPTAPLAKVVVNSRTGSVAMNRQVILDNAAVAHGNLSVTISRDLDVSQPAPFSTGQTQVVERGGEVDISETGGALINVAAGARLDEVVNALNALRASPMDLISILQALKASGALRAELEII
ncbi:MAG: flagellar basal body P-ring protein FlgI [Sphingobacteriia bacterium]|nr:flagellar basal body P-ring protein FlgI [Sphingobacteriia bacterium]NCC38998.1 flagellar basal body P-ring protein FlgI [Gammaproteobacteria bacterium]